MVFGKMTYKRPLNLIAAVNIIAYTFLFIGSSSYEWGTLAIGSFVTLIICSACYVIIRKHCWRAVDNGTGHNA